MAVFSFLFGGSSASSNGGNSSKPRSANNYPTSSSSPAYPPSTSQHGAADGEYDDVALGGSGADGAYPPSRPSFSAPAATAGSFVGGGGGGGGYSVEASYPPLPSFSRPSGSLSHASSSSISSGGGGGGKYPSLPSTFARLEALLSTHSPLLLDSLSPPLPYGRRDEALLSLQAAIAPYTLPPAVIDSYLCHDGQDSLSFTGAGGKGDVGLVYGLWWLPLERVEEEWRFWRRLESAGGLIGPGVGGDAFSASSSSSASTRGVGGRAHPYRPEERAEQGRAQGEAEEGDLEGMSAFPPGWVRARYSHPGWLPLLTDRCGNYIGVDLDPPPPSPSPASPTNNSFPSHSRTNSSSLNNHGHGVTPQKAYGQPGQVIAFGREIDEKVVLFPGDGPGGWARFLAAFVEDVERGEVARLGEGTATASRWGDEESGRGGGSGSSGEDGEGEGEGAWGEAGDGLGERGYFESAGVYGDEAEEGSGRGRKVGGQTWILRAPYRRMAAQLSLLSDGGGGIIGLLAERSRRKWRSLGVGTRIVAPNGVNGVEREPLKVVVPNGVSAHGGEEQPGSAATMKPGVFSGEQEKPQVEGQENQPPSSRTATPHPLAPLDTTAASADASSSSSNVELTFSPPSPTATFNNGPPLPPPSSSSSSRRTSHESSRSRTSSHDGSQYLQQPPRRSSGSQQPRQRQPRRPPPPPAPVGLPTFSELDFSDAIADPSASSTAGYGGRGAVPIPTATWLLNDGADRPSPLQQQQQNSGGLMSRLSSFGSSGPTPTRESLLPTSRPSSVAAVSPPPASPRLSSSSSRSDHHSIPMHHSRDLSTEEGTDDVPLRVPDERSRSTAALVGGESPPVSPLEGEGEAREATLEVVVEGEEGAGAGVKRTASPADQPYEGEGR